MSRILFITSNRLGDAVLSTGLLDHLTGAYPDARLTIACGPLPAPLFRSVPGLERLMSAVVEWAWQKAKGQRRAAFL